MDIKTLITKVYRRPELWDKNNKLYDNRLVVQGSWLEIANEMGVSEELVRKKWIYLKHQFGVQYNKVSLIHPDGREVVFSKPKWPHYDSLLFLKDVQKCRGSFSNTRMSKKHSSDKPNNIGDNKSLRRTGFEDFKNSTHSGTRKLKPNSSENYKQNISCLKKRRTLERADYKIQTLNEIESMKQLLEETMKRYQMENDDLDLLFFRSLLPHVSKIPEEMKLQFRSKIQEVVDEFAYNSGSS